MTSSTSGTNHGSQALGEAERTALPVRGDSCARARWIKLAIGAVALVACTENVVPPEPAESGILRGTVTLEGEPRGGATIRITDPVGAGLSTTGTSDANGQYAKEIVAGRWNVSVLLNTEAVVDCPTYSNVTVSENRESVRDFACTLVRGTLRGIVMRDGAPVPGQPVQIVNQSNADVTTVVTNAEGEYSAQLLPGSYAAFTMIVGAQCVAEPLVVDVVASQTASSPIGCTTIPGTLTGTVTVDGRPVPAGFPVTI